MHILTLRTNHPVLYESNVLHSSTGEIVGRPLTIDRTIKGYLLRLGSKTYIRTFLFNLSGHDQMTGRIGQVVVSESAEVYSLELLPKHHKTDVELLYSFL